MIDPEEITRRGAKQAFDQLSNLELAAINNVAHFPGADPTRVMGYAKVAHLFEHGKMHALVVSVLESECIRRLNV